MSQSIIKTIREKNWDLRVNRPGFLQSKYIVSRALTREVHLSNSVIIKDTSNIWINSTNLYNQDVVDQLMGTLLQQVFAENPKWPLDVVEKLDEAVKQKDDFVEQSQAIDWQIASKEQKVAYMQQYVDVLTNIQQYYVFAVPLTNYCEVVLRDKDPSLLEYAVQLKALDVDHMNESLFTIKERGSENSLIEEHVKRFAWIKTNYNIVEPYTKEEVLQELRSDTHVFETKEVPSGPWQHIALGLQAGIYLRNKMKEASQQVWYAFDPFAQQIAVDLGISRDDFLQLYPDEVLDAVEAGNLKVSQEEVDKRNSGFITGVIDDTKAHYTGPEVERLYEYFNGSDTTEISEVKGTVASLGFVVGTVKVITDMSEIHKLEDDDILVTRMTTPDFVVAMKKAGAIVTDEGGLSCHAAIVSRELNKPCIIGTKIATKVLKDGDMVEVDANNGLVKIIKSKT